MAVLNIYHPDIYEYLNAKAHDKNELVHFNLSIMVDDDFMKAKNNNEDIWLHYPVYDNESKLIKDESKWLIKKKVNATELWNSIMDKAYNTGEYGIFFYENLNNDNNTWYAENIISSNPCFRGDMRLLTKDGYVQIKDLENMEVDIINKDGVISHGKVWCSGKKEIYEIKLTNRQKIYCTEDHRFMLNDGSECIAKNLKGKQLMPYLNENIETNKEFELYGFIQGDGTLGRLKSDAHLGLEVNIGEKDYDVAEYFMIDPKDRKFYLVGFKERLIELGFSSEQLPNRVFPTTINSWSKIDKQSFLRGLYTANGSILSCGRITFKTTCKELTKEISDLLKEFDINSYITTNKSHDVKFSNGTYPCKESYDININKYSDKIKFFNNIGFLQKYKIEKLKNHLIEKSPVVTRSNSTKTVEKVYDFSEPLTHWGVVEDFIVHNCGEYVSGNVFYSEVKNDELKGACNLGSLLLQNFVVYPFTKKAYIDMCKLEETTRTAVRLLDNIIDINKFPHPSFEKYQKSFRTIGLGITGLADMLIMLNMTYGDNDSCNFVKKLTNQITKWAYWESIQISQEKGSFLLLDKNKFIQSGFIRKHIEYDDEWLDIVDNILKYGIRNARMISIAPVGTISLTYGNNCSSGLEPIFSLEYDRKIKIGGQDESNIQIVKMRDYAYEQWLKLKDNNECIVTKEKFVTAMDLPVSCHINMLESIAFNTDMSCSKTINIPTNYSLVDTMNVYDECWKKGIKGCTIFRPNEIRQGILIDNTTKPNNVNETIKNLKRGDWKPLADDTIYIKKPLKIGCGKLKLFIGYSPSENAIQDLYIKKAGNGGCTHNIEAVAVGLSAIYRLGGSTINIEKAFSGLGGCNSFLQARISGKDLSKGSSCATAILNILQDVEQELQVNNSIITKINIDNKSDKIKKRNEEEELYLVQNGETAYAIKYHKCPICNEVLLTSGGCLQCTCGYSKCE